MAANRVGQLIGKRYRLVKHISEGGYGSVYQGIDIQLNNELVAVKLLRPPSGADAEDYDTLQRRFMDEARVSALLGEHPNIVKVKSYGVHEQQPYLVMEFLGEPPAVGQGLDQLTRTEGPMEPTRMVKLARQICSALYYAHRFQVDLGKYSIKGVLHRDIKPSNLFIIREPNGNEYVKVLDFGISKFMGQMDTGLTRSGYFVGTMCYSSPEQMRGKPLDVRSDIYSLGVVLYEMLTAYPPLVPDTDSLPGWYHVHNYQRPRPFEELPLKYPIPKLLQEVVLSCLEKDPNYRPRSMQELSEQLQSAIEGQKVVVAPKPNPTPKKVATPAEPLGSRSPMTVEVMGEALFTSHQATEETEFQEAVQKIHDQDYRGAIQILNRLIHRSPNEVRYYLQRALAHQRQGNEGMALMDFQGVLRLDPDCLEAQQGLALLDPAHSAMAAEATKASAGQPVLSAPRSGSPVVPWLAWLGAHGLASGVAGWSLLQLEALGTTLWGSLAGGVVVGVALGVAQVGVLGRRLVRGWMWVLASVVGYGVAFGLVALLAEAAQISLRQMIMSPVAAIIGSVGVGVLQWLVLRRQGVRALSWILTNGIDGIIVAGIATLTTAFPGLGIPLLVWVACRPLAGWLLLDLLSKG
ncbi:MAG: protein kinase [Thermostichales cyanobacterium HHBFW_bins_127]